MLKVALIIVFVSSSNTSINPDVSIASFYDNMKDCQIELDNIKKNLNVTEFLNKNNIRTLKMQSREAHQEGFIYFSCHSKTNN